MANIEQMAYFIGIDISKKTLDIAVLHENNLVYQDTILNNKKSLKNLFSLLSKKGIDLVRVLYVGNLQVFIPWHGRRAI